MVVTRRHLARALPLMPAVLGSALVDVLDQFQRRRTNLHRFWDGDQIDHAYPNATALYKSVQAVL